MYRNARKCLSFFSLFPDSLTLINTQYSYDIHTAKRAGILVYNNSVIDLNEQASNDHSSV